jgi:hypothetical protein
MDYKYVPIYKYAIFLITSYTFLKHQNIIPMNKLLINVVLLTLLIMGLDFVLIRHHPYPFNMTDKIDDNYTYEKSHSKKSEHFSLINENEIDDIIESCDLDEEENDYDENENNDKMNEEIYNPYIVPILPQSKYAYKRKHYGY